MSLENPINIYACQKCGKAVVTKDIDEGVTPFMMGCVFGCGGDMVSMFYAPPNNLTPAYEWYRPRRKKRKSREDEECLSLRSIETGEDV